MFTVSESLHLNCQRVTLFGDLFLLSILFGDLNQHVKVLILIKKRYVPNSTLINVILVAEAIKSL